MSAKKTLGSNHQEEIRWITTFRSQTCFMTKENYLLTKRVIDITIVLLFIPLWLPIIILISLSIKILSPKGPVFFFQDRTGKGGRRFTLFKFRTMVPDAEKMKKELVHLNELQWPDFKIKNDPRIFTLGKILRKSSLDELPQLFNVLRGDMSLVGPRPTSFGSETYKLWHTERLDVPPGITGLWQIVARGSTEFDDRLCLDLTYIKHSSICLDIHILLRTFLSIAKQRGTF